jgi:hypothetical protein
MERHRRAALRICDVHVADGGRYHGMPQDVLHLGQVHTSFQQIGSTAMPKLDLFVFSGLWSGRWESNPRPKLGKL